ncbi:MAG: phenylacetate--CoA ligase family protein [Desulfobacteraceae bacterium]|jgi:phenylacetate-CoA ligase|nr:MAG: phenylacetate--CoA ligase family protein [Desulfobacteraceae bacterium]
MKGQGRFWNKEVECLELEKARRLQEERFLSIVKWAYAKTPFYKRKFDEAGITPDDIRSVNDVVKIPFTKKDDLRISQENQPPYGEHCALPAEIFQTYWSTGTTGFPTLMGVSKTEADYWLDVVARSLYSTGLRKQAKFHHATQLSSFPGGYLFLSAAQRIGANIIPAGAGNTERHIWLISKLKPTFIKILPSYANYLAEKGYDMGIDMSASSIKQVYLSAEPAPPDLRTMIEKKLGAVTYDNYGLSDIGQPEAYECEAHDGLHVIPDWCLTEIIDPETKEPIHEAGREGVLVYTNLVRKTMPMVRFWTANPSCWKTFDPCTCGRTAPRIMSVYRRVDDMIKVKGVNFWPGAVWSVLKDYAQLTGVHRIFLESREGKEYLRIAAEIKKDVIPEAGGLKNALIERLRSALFIQVDEMELVPPGTLQAAEHKDKAVVDLRKK